MPEKFRQATSETPLSPQEQFLRESLPTQFNTQTASLRAVGLLESIFKENTSADDNFVIELQEGITGMDGKAYALPTIEEIQKHFSQEKYAEKIDQGFTKLLIVPFAYPLATIRARYEEALIKHYKEGKLLDSDGNKLDLDTKRPLYFLEELNKSDETGDLIYYPIHFDTENHGGYTKQELLTSGTADVQIKSPFSGFHVLLIKPDLIIPRASQGVITGGRKDLEANRSAEEYLKTIQTISSHFNEQGMTLEDSLILALINLHETNMVMDDFTNDKNSVNFNIANFHKHSGDIPNSYWYRTGRRVNVSMVSPEDADYNFGTRVAVG